MRIRNKQPCSELQAVGKSDKVELDNLLLRQSYKRDVFMRQMAECPLCDQISHLTACGTVYTVQACVTLLSLPGCLISFALSTM